MKTGPIIPGTLNTPALQGAAPRAGQLLQGAGLPGGWAGRQRFALLDTAFGAGHAFLAAWRAWRADPARCDRLVVVAIEAHPLCTADLRPALAGGCDAELARQLHAAWPPLTHNLHRLSFEQGRVQLLLAFGDRHQWLPELVAQADALFLQGDGWDRYQLKSLAKLAAPGAALSAVDVSDSLAKDLVQAGFEVHQDGASPRALYRPRFLPQRPAARTAVAPDARHAVVVGAGLAGCATAWALAQQGLRVTLLDQGQGIAQASSGNAVGLFHGTLNPDDGLHARFNRAAALETQRVLDTLELPWRLRGLLRTESTRSLAQMQTVLGALGLPMDYAQALPAEAASALSGLSLDGPAWFYPGGGALPPAALAQAFLNAAESPITVRLGVTVGQLHRADDTWLLLDERRHVLEETPLVVLAAGIGSLDLLAARQWPLRLQRGQITRLPAQTPGLRVPALPVAGTGYVVPDGLGGVWCGATAQDHDAEPSLRDSDHAHNIAQLMRLSGARLNVGLENGLPGRVGWRLIAEDRLPLVGGLPAPDSGVRRDQPRLISRQPGLLVATAMASRGITWAALCGQVLASLATGAPCPVEASLLDAIDPARFDARRARTPDQG